MCGPRHNSCSFPGADDNSLFQKFERQHKPHPHYHTPQMRHHTPVFTIVHYASDVTYSVKVPVYKILSFLQRYRGVLYMAVPFRDVFYTKVPFMVSFIQRCTLYRGVLYTELSFVRRCPLYRDVLYTEVSFIQRCPLYRGVLYTEVSFIQRCPLY